MPNYIYGLNTVKEALKGSRIKKVFINRNCKLKDDIVSKHMDYEIVDNAKLDKLSRCGNHQGIVALCEDYRLFELKDIVKENDGLLIILDGITDPHNFGAIIRTCEAGGIDGIIYKKNNSAKINDTVAKVASGALEYMKLVEVTNLNSTINKLKDLGYWIIGTSDKAEKDYTSLDYKGNIAIVIGSEGKGISRLVKENCDYLVSLPIKGHVNSLNASVATGIFIYNAIYQRVINKK